MAQHAEEVRVAAEAQAGPGPAGPLRIFLAGATGVIGIRLLPLLVAGGHTVAAMTRSAGKRDLLASMGAEPVVCDVFDAEALRSAVVAFRPDAVLHQLTDLPDTADQIPEYAARNARIRTEGTRNLLQAAGSAGIVRFVAQSIAWTPTSGGTSVAEHERLILDAGGVVLRYGQFYGPGTYYPDTLPDPPRVHIDQAASRTVELLDSPTGVITILD